RFGGIASESERHDEAPAAGPQVDLAGQGDVAVARLAIAPAQLEMSRKILPAIRDADEAGRAREERRRAAERERGAAAFGEQHRRALVIVDPGAVAGAAVHEVRG